MYPCIINFTLVRYKYSAWFIATLTAAAALANSLVAFLFGDVTEAESSLVSKEKADIVIK